MKKLLIGLIILIAIFNTNPVFSAGTLVPASNVSTTSGVTLQNAIDTIYNNISTNTAEIAALRTNDQTQETRIGSNEVALLLHVSKANAMNSSGKLSGGIFTHDGSFGVNYTTMEVALKTRDSQEAELAYYLIPAGNVSGASLTLNHTNYIYLDYNNGSPQILVTTDRDTIRTTDQLDLVRVFKNNATTYVGAQGFNSANFARREHERTYARGVAERFDGALIAEKATRYVTITASTWYVGTSLITKAASDSQINGFEHYFSYNANTDTWTDNVTTYPNQIDNTKYNDTSDGSLKDLANNQYGVHWIYLGGASKLSVVFGHNTYKLSEAIEVQPPMTLPNYLAEFGVLVGKIIIKKNESIFTSIDSAFETIFATGIVEHNDTLNRDAADAHPSTSISAATTEVSDGTTVQDHLDSNAVYITNNHVYGFTEDGRPTISYDANTQTLSIGANVVYCNGKRYVKSATTITHPATTGIHYFYYDSNGVLTTSTNVWNILSTAQIAFVVYNASNVGTKGFLCNELHGMVMDTWTHLYEHVLSGAKAANIFTIGDYSLQPSSPTTNGNTFSISGGNIYDEDNKHIISPLTDNSTIPIFWREGANGEWFWQESTYPVAIGTTYPKYNQYTGGVWTTTEVAANTYLNMWLCATGAETANYKYMLIMGQYSDSTLAAAEARSFYNLSIGNNFFAEVVPIQRITFRTNTGYTNALGRCRIEAVSSLYGTSITLGNIVTQTHNSLTGRTDSGAHPGSSITYTDNNNLGVITAQDALDTLAVLINSLDLRLDSVENIFIGGVTGEVLTRTDTGFVWATIPSGVTDHTLLSNIGTKTHAQLELDIDSLMSNPAGISRVYIDGVALPTGEVEFKSGTNITLNVTGSTVEIVATGGGGTGATVETILNQNYVARSQGTAEIGFFSIYDFDITSSVIVADTIVPTINGLVQYETIHFTIGTWDDGGTNKLRITFANDVSADALVRVSCFTTLPLLTVISADNVSTTNGWLQDGLDAIWIAINDRYTKAETDATIEAAIAAIPTPSVNQTVNQTVTVTAAETLAAGDVVSLIGIETITAKKTDNTNVVGICQNACNTGEVATILLKGTDTNQSGMTIGENYYRQIDYSIGTDAVLIDGKYILIGIAKSSIEIILN